MYPQCAGCSKTVVIGQQTKAIMAGVLNGSTFTAARAEGYLCDDCFEMLEVLSQIKKLLEPYDKLGKTTLDRFQAVLEERQEIESALDALQPNDKGVDTLGKRAAALCSDWRKIGDELGQVLNKEVGIEALDELKRVLQERRDIETFIEEQTAKTVNNDLGVSLLDRLKHTFTSSRESSFPVDIRI